MLKVILFMTNAFSNEYPIQRMHGGENCLWAIRSAESFAHGNGLIIITKYHGIKFLIPMVAEVVSSRAREMQESSISL